MFILFVQIIVAPPVVHMATMDSPLPTFPMVPTAVPPAQVALVSSSSVTTTEKEETTVRRPPWKKKRASKTRDEEEDEDDEEFVPYDDSEEEGVAEDEDDEDFQGCTEGTTKRKATKRKQKQRRVASSNEEVDDEKNEEDDTASTMYRSSVRYSYPLRIGPDGAFSAERVIIPVDELISINESRRPGSLACLLAFYLLQLTCFCGLLSSCLFFWCTYIHHTHARAQELEISSSALQWGTDYYSINELNR